MRSIGRFRRRSKRRSRMRVRRLLPKPPTCTPTCTPPNNRAQHTMAIKTFRTALNEAMRLEMRRDPRVILLGEDIAGGIGGAGEEDAWGGVMGVTKGLLGEFGPDRVL